LAESNFQGGISCLKVLTKQKMHYGQQKRVQEEVDEEYHSGPITLGGVLVLIILGQSVATLVQDLEGAHW